MKKKRKSLGNGVAGPDGPEVQVQLLEKAKQTIQVESFYMKRALDEKQIMEALKHGSNMIGQLRTNLLSPKQYYDLYMFCFDQLKYLEAFLVDEKERGGVSLFQLYELVQYAGNLLPRLYLLITIGVAQIRAEEDSSKVILFDLAEMCRGVQHPLRGLFLRNYLSEMTRDKLPDVGNRYEQKGGNVADSIEFILANFTEMNKLWVRMEPLQGSILPREREQKQKERDELRLLVGKNLARIGQLEGVDLETYRKVVLPRISEQVVACQDKVSQQYLMECIVQIFPDEYHLVTLDELLSLLRHLDSTVNIKAIVVSLLARLINFAERNPDLKERIESVGAHKVNIFEIFFRNLQAMFEGQAKDSVTTLADQLEMLVNLMNLTLKFYPKIVGNVDAILGFCTKLLEIHQVKTCTQRGEVTNLTKLLKLPLTTFSVVIVLDLPTTPLLQFLNRETQKRIALDFLTSMIDHGTRITELGVVKKLFDFISPVINDVPPESGDEEDEEEYASEQNLLASALHLLQSPDPVVTFKICVLIKDVLTPAGSPPKRLLHILVPVVFKVLSITSLLKKLTESHGADWIKRGKEIFQFVYRLVTQLKSINGTLSLRLSLQAAQVACGVGFGMIGNDFLCEALVLYEEIPHAPEEQQSLLTLIISTLNSVRGVDAEKYDPLATKCAHHSARILKKIDQCRLILKCSHLFTRSNVQGDYDGRFTLDCLQKCLRVADTCLEAHLKVQLFVDILNECLYFFVNKSETVTVQFLNSLLDLINTNIQGERSSLSPTTSLYYKNTVNFIKMKQQGSTRWAGVEVEN